MTEEIVIDRTVSRFGLHGAHVLTSGARVERELWMRDLVPEDAEQVEFWEYEEKDTGIFHLRLWWKEKGAKCYEWIG